MLTNIIQFPQSFTPQPPRPTKALPATLRFLTVAIAYIRIAQARLLLPLIFPYTWHFQRGLEISVNGFPVSDGDRVADVRAQMDKSRRRWGVVGQLELRAASGLQGVAA
jgi:hypothetical protein